MMKEKWSGQGGLALPPSMTSSSSLSLTKSNKFYFWSGKLKDSVLGIHTTCGMERSILREI